MSSVFLGLTVAYVEGAEPIRDESVRRKGRWEASNQVPDNPVGDAQTGPSQPGFQTDSTCRHAGPRGTISSARSHVSPWAAAVCPYVHCATRFDADSQTP